MNAIAWLVEREKERDDLLIDSRRSNLTPTAKNMIQSAINAADEKDKHRNSSSN